MLLCYPIFNQPLNIFRFKMIDIYVTSLNFHDTSFFSFVFSPLSDVDDLQIFFSLPVLSVRRHNSRKCVAQKDHLTSLRKLFDIQVHECGPNITNEISTYKYVMLIKCKMTNTFNNLL